MSSPRSTEEQSRNPRVVPLQAEFQLHDTWKSYPQFPVGRTDRLKRRSESQPRSQCCPVGRTDRDVGRTGTTRCYPVGRTGQTTNLESTTLY